ncbi:protein BNIP5 [Callospermophilus lateralis]|uniref:protein BNIP5 n=1 Tax=Callospermophilus lateralis TaxID=76772 RepID=UPI00403863E3
METPRGPQKPSACRRAQSLDRPQAPRKDSGSGNCQCLSFSTTPCRRPLRRTSSDGARHSGIPTQSAEAQGTVTTALTLEEMRGLLPSEQRPQQDAKKDKAQRRAQQGWLKAVLNFFLRTGPEEPREKASKRPKGKEEPSEPPDGPGEPALRTRARDKKASRKKHSHRKHDAEDPEAGLPRTEAASAEEADLGPAGRGGHDSYLHPSSPIKVGGAGFSDISPQAAGPQPEEHLRKRDQDAVIQRIVDLLKKVGDQWEEEVRQQLQVPQPEVALQNPSPVCRRTSQERKSSLKRAFSLKKYGPGSEESRRAGAADVPKKSSFLPMCVGSHRSSISSSPGLEEPEVHEALSADGEGPSPSEPPAHARCQGPVEELPLDGTSESNKFIQKILALLQDAEEQEGEQQPQVQEVEVAVENPAPVCRKKSQEKKSSLRRAFSHKKHSSKEPRRAGTDPEAGTPKRPSYLPLCVGGHRSSISSSSDPEHPEFQEPLAAKGGASGFPASSSQTRSHTPEGGPPPEDTCESKEGTICTLVELLQEVDGELGDQIGRHPSFKRFFYEFSDSTLRKLVATLRRRKTHSPGGARSLAQRPSPYAFGLVHKFAGSHSRTICSLMGSRGHCVQHNFTQFPSREAQPNMPSPECQSPD